VLHTDRSMEQSGLELIQIISTLPVSTDSDKYSRPKSGDSNMLPAFMRLANISKNNKSVKFDQILYILRAFLVNCSPHKLFLNKLQSTEHFFSGMWPSHKFEFQTLDRYLY
jgi:hypothetical protein